MVQTKSNIASKGDKRLNYNAVCDHDQCYYNYSEVVAKNSHQVGERVNDVTDGGRAD